jgi:two-component sensor histidine kinase
MTFKSIHNLLFLQSRFGVKKHLSLRQHSLSKQLLSCLGTLLAIVSIAIIGVSYQFVQASLHKQVHEQAQSITQTLEFATEGPIEIGYTTIVQRVVENYATLPTILETAIVSPTYQTIAHSTQELRNRPYTAIHPELVDQVERTIRSGIETSFEARIEGQLVIVQILPFSSALFDGAERRGLAITISDLKQIQQEIWKTFVSSTLTMLAGMVVILLLMGVLIQKIVLSPLYRLNRAVIQSQETGRCNYPIALPANEIQFLANTFHSVFEQRQHVELALRNSEERERSKSQQLQAELVERQQIEAQLRASLQEKDVLLKEVHHRVKNNMQMISSLLKLQVDSIQDPEVLKPFIESQQRIKAMALVHEKLYQNNNLAKINFTDYVRQLVRELFHSFNVARSRIRLSIEITEIDLTVDVAIPCGLIINELVSNALKYAFPDGKSGRIRIFFAPDTSKFTDRNSHYILSIQDDGIGITKSINLQNIESLGLQLVYALTEQLRGTIKLDSTEGTTFDITLCLPDEKMVG